MLIKSYMKNKLWLWMLRWFLSSYHNTKNIRAKYMSTILEPLTSIMIIIGPENESMV